MGETVDQRTKDHYEFEYLEKYYGDAYCVKKAIEDCPSCNSKLVLSHLADSGSLLVHESARCFDCDFIGRKLIHTMN